MKKSAKVSGAMNKLWKVRSLVVNVKKIMYDRIVVPSVLYGAKKWALKERKKKRLEVK